MTPILVKNFATKKDMQEICNCIYAKALNEIKKVKAKLLDDRASEIIQEQCCMYNMYYIYIPL